MLCPYTPAWLEVTLLDDLMIELRAREIIRNRQRFVRVFARDPDFARRALHDHMNCYLSLDETIRDYRRGLITRAELLDHVARALLVHAAHIALGW